MSWKCEKCENVFDNVNICWGISGGQKVDIIDYFCPHCGNTGYLDELKLIFQGTKEEEDEYWNKQWSK